MPTVEPPYDRAIALACAMRTLRGRWLHSRCRCNTAKSVPVKLMLQDDPYLCDRSLADVLVGLRCSQCGDRLAAVYLAEDARGPHVSGAPAGWSILLHGVPPRVPEPSSRGR